MYMHVIRIFAIDGSNFAVEWYVPSLILQCVLFIKGLQYP